MNFRELVEREAAYKDPARKPRSMAAMAERCGIHRSHLYNLFAGMKTPPAWTVAQIAKGLSVDAATVEKALQRSRAEAMAERKLIA